MDQATQEAVLAHMAYRIVDNRRRALAQTIALRLLRENGQVSASEVLAGLAAEWVEPPAGEVANLVAKKCAAAIGYHQAEAALAASVVPRAEEALRRAQRRLDEAADRVEAAYADETARAAEDAAAQAEALLAAAVAAGGDPGLAPGGADAAAAAQVAHAVGEAMSTGDA